jgi:hypothetical protein
MNTVHYCAKKGEEKENVEGKMLSIADGEANNMKIMRKSCEMRAGDE